LIVDTVCFDGQALRECDGVRLRRLESGDLEAAHALSVAVNWPHRLDDWRFVAALGEGLVAERDGKIVGTALGWHWGEARAILGMVIVAPEVQGRRIGQRLMQGLLEAAGERAVLLHATVAGRGLYERLGFVTIGEIRQHQGLAQQAPLIMPEAGERLRPLGRNDAPRLVELDAQAGGMPRKAAIRALLEVAETVVLDRDGEAAGFAAIRRFGRGYAIGPVVAPDLRAAQALIGHWVNLHARKFVRIDVEAGGGLTEWLESIGLRRVGMVAVMNRGPVPARAAGTGFYALLNQAVG